MIMQGFSVFDKAVGAYLPLFFARSKGEAIRSFAAVVQKPDHQFYNNKSDYTLFFVGSWDDQSGLFSPVEPSRVISAMEIGDPA